MQKIELHQEVILKKVFHTFYGPLLLFAGHFIKDRASCEDIVQQLFVKLYSERRKFENNSMMRSYLYTAIKNKCLNHLAHEKTKNDYKTLTEHSAEQASFYEIEVEAANLLHLSIKKLPERQKQIVLLHLKGMGNEVIAQRLGISEQTVKNLKAKAYNSLRKYLKET